MSHYKIQRGIISVRADVGDVKATIEQLHKAFHDFKAEHQAQLDEVKKGNSDALQALKVDRINAEIDRLQKSVDEVNAKAAAIQLGGAPDNRVKDREYTDAFKAHIRKGEVQASLNKGVASEGGYTAPTEWDRTITDKLIQVSPMRQICSVQTISTGSLSKLFNLRGTTSGWVGETAARPETAAPTLGSLTYAVGEIYANPAATQQMLDDSLVDLETWLAGEVQTEFAYQENLAFVSGTGANNRPNGILTYITGGANAAAHPFGAILATNSGSAAALTADGIVNLVHALPSAFTGNARFVMNRNTMGKVRLLKDTANQYLWQPSYQAGQPSTLAGYAVTEVPAMPDVAAAAKAILFGDFQRAYQIVDSVGVRVLRDPFTNKPYVMFYTTKRVGGGLLNPEAVKAQNVSV